MTNRIAQKEMTMFVIVVMLFLGAMAALKIFDSRTNEIGKLGSIIVSKFIKI